MAAVALDLFAAGADRLVYSEALDLTLASLRSYGPLHRHWAVAWSGGKDSTATLTLLIHLIESGQLPRPETLTVYYADTRMELVPLAIAAAETMRQLARFPWIRVRVVTAPLDKRFLVYILGRGVPPPNNNTLRWCTRQIKVDPMAAAIAADLDGRDDPDLAEAMAEMIGHNGGPVLADGPEDQAAETRDTVLMITGVRQGESAIRDRRIEMSCGRDGAECGQGWYQLAVPEAKGVRGRIFTLAPLLHWRVCHVWDWLRIYAPAEQYGGWSTAMVADAYGGDEAEELAARTGCLCCPLASNDRALDKIIRHPSWSYLAPLKRLREIYRRLRLPANRLRKPGAEVLKNGKTAKNPQRLGPITLPVRLAVLEEILSIQAEVNAAAVAGSWPSVDILNAEEEARIRALIAAGTWPDKWSGDEPTGDVPLDAVYPDGSVQPLLT
ncbi:phosphoadenosine phosphosulfate reductase [Methylobacterium indicum]|uniref:phosphoadenosine phosphosulfate reductase domain-containing protein n=1 Tax=Methylobacterium indicum TaxID=1775910 RepID=UPI0007343DF1|nr:phosphoadenosine phosphosulfate reductase family protein [Methylobacterium indicum]KTS30891.1 phosphoadenosine phosphosulfate reductase [Methylobacterium indicum]KTS41522.1 phosphoadenosine phosphosulfate reductase [Methylobacterium indicum]KTS52424.1 phosphoadenosine phosphosulfate reductase [Methylobacterium indicum]